MKPLNSDLVDLLKVKGFLPNVDEITTDDAGTHYSYVNGESTIVLEVIKKACKANSKNAVESHLGNWYKFVYIFWRETEDEEYVVIAKFYSEEEAISYIGVLDADDSWADYAVPTKTRASVSLDEKFELLVERFKLKKVGKTEYERKKIQVEVVKGGYTLWRLDKSGDYNEIETYGSLLELAKALKAIHEDGSWNSYF